MNKDYLIIEKALPLEICQFLCDYTRIKRTACAQMLATNAISPYDDRFGFFGDLQVPNKKTFIIHGDATFDTVLVKLQPIIEKEVGKELIPTYSYFRAYQKGDDLYKHKDRKACEFSITLNLGGDPWPIFMAGEKLTLTPGDLVIYKGCEIEHWREPFEGTECFQLFLHYNDPKDKEASLYDDRVALGTQVKRFKWVRDGS